jgi:hypothetical protein
LFAGGGLLCLGGLMVGVLFGYYPQPIRGGLDRRLLRRHFDLPSGLRLVAYDGYPPMVGFGQREGLNIRAVYRVPERKAEVFKRRLNGDGWLPLPMPAELQDKIRPYVTDDTLALASGLYLCRTAGNDVLHARETHPCTEVARLSDVIFGAFDSDAHLLYLQVGSGY